MNDVTTVAEKRDELKRQLADGEYAALLDVFGYRTGRFLQKLTRTAKPISFGYAILLVLLLLLLIGLFIAGLFDEFNWTQALFMLGGVVLYFVALIIFRIHQNILIAHLHDHIIDAITSTNDLADLQHWLVRIRDKKATLFFAVVFALVAPAPGFFFLSTLSGNLVGFGVLIQTVLSLVIVGMGIYFFVLFFNLPIRLSRYRFKVYAADPASSGLIHRLSGMFTTSLYLFALLIVLATIVTAGLAIGRLPSIVFLRFLILWGSIVVLFSITQYSLSKIITTAKNEALTDVQAQIEQLQANAKLSDKETRDTLNWLMDYHERIKATRNSALDLRAILSFVNSLILPLVAFVLTNLETIRTVLHWPGGQP